MSRSVRTIAPFRIAVLAEFRSRVDRAVNDFTLPDPIKVDCDNFDAVFRRFEPTLHLPPWAEGTDKIELRLQKLEDFHPDQLLGELEPLSRLIKLRERLLIPASADAAEKELQGLGLIPATLLPSESAPSAPKESEEETLARLLGRTASDPRSGTSPVSAINHLIKQLVAPNLVPGPSPKQSQLVALAESELTERLRKILHSSDFQTLEATWRGLDFLVRAIGDGVDLYLIDIGKSELERVLLAEDLSRIAIYKQLQIIQPVVALGIHTFGAEDGDLLKRIGKMASGCHTAFVSGANQQLVGCRSFDLQPDPDDWAKISEMTAFEVFRRSPEAEHVGLVQPRFLLRQPYGKRSDPIEAFPFEEMTAIPGHESYLWGNPAFLYGCLLADGFAKEGWESDTGEGGVVGGLPVHEYKGDGETKVKPCAEAWLSERAAETILDHGIMPVLSVRGSDEVRLSPLRSCANPSQALAVGSLTGRDD